MRLKNVIAVHRGAKPVLACSFWRISAESGTNEPRIARDEGGDIGNEASLRDDIR